MEGWGEEREGGRIVAKLKKARIKPLATCSPTHHLWLKPLLERSHCTLGNFKKMTCGLCLFENHNCIVLAMFWHAYMGNKKPLIRWWLSVTFALCRANGFTTLVKQQWWNPRVFSELHRGIIYGLWSLIPGLTSNIKAVSTRLVPILSWPNSENRLIQSPLKSK